MAHCTDELRSNVVQEANRLPRHDPNVVSTQLGAMAAKVVPAATVNFSFNAVKHLLVGNKPLIRPTRTVRVVPRIPSAEKLSIGECLKLTQQGQPPQSWYDEDDNPFEP